MSEVPKWVYRRTKKRMSNSNRKFHCGGSNSFLNTFVCKTSKYFISLFLTFQHNCASLNLIVDDL